MPPAAGTGYYLTETGQIVKAPTAEDGRWANSLVTDDGEFIKSYVPTYPTYVGNIDNFSTAVGSSTSNITVASNIDLPIGTTIVGILVTTSAGSIIAIDDITGGGPGISEWTWPGAVPDGTEPEENSGSTDQVHIFSGVVGPTGYITAGGGIVITLRSPVTRAIAICAAFDNIDNSGLRFDKSAVNLGTGTAMTTGASAALAQPNEIVVGAFGWGKGSGQTGTAGAGWTSPLGEVATAVGTTDRAGLLEFKQVAATTAQNAAASLSASSVWSAALATYKCFPIGAGAPSAVAASDPAVGTEAVTRIAISVADSAVGGEATALATSTADSGSAAETASATGTTTASDAAIGAESVSGATTRSDPSAAAEAAGLRTSASDSAAGAETATLATPASDTSTAAETAAVTGTATASDTASGADTVGTLRQSTADPAVAVEVAGLATTSADTGTATETAGTASTVSAADAATSAETVGTLLASTSDPAVGADVAATYLIAVLPPVSDVTVGAWTTNTGATSNLYAAIDESTADDSDYIQSEATPVNSPTTVALASATDPGVSTGHVISYRYQMTGTGLIDLVVDLMQGGTVIASWTHTSIPASWVTAAQTLTGTQADSISDYTALRLRFTANQAG